MFLTDDRHFYICMFALLVLVTNLEFVKYIQEGS